MPGGVAPQKGGRNGGKCRWCRTPIGWRAKSTIITFGAITNRDPINATGTCARGIIVPRQVTPIGRGAKRSSQSRRGLNPIDRVANSGQRHRIAPIG
jgi:hypothetical protein